MTFYFDDDEAQEDREPPLEGDQIDQDDLEGAPPAGRFYLDVEEVVGPLPVIRDRAEGDSIVARFVTLAAADQYMKYREVGFSHKAALARCGEI